MGIEFVSSDGRRTRLPRGWVIIILTLAAWGGVAIVGLLGWGLVQVIS